MKQVRYGSEVGMLLFLGILIKMGRVTCIGILIPLLLIVALEINENIVKREGVRQSLLFLLVTFSLWIFNDLMAIGKFSVDRGKTALINYVLYGIIFLFFFGVFGNRKWAYIVPESLLFLVGIANAVIKAIRRTPLSAGDIFSIKTAMAVAGNYRMEFDKDFILKVGAGCVLVILTNVILVCCLWGQNRKQGRTIQRRVICIGVFAICAAILFGTSWIANFSGRAPDYFTHETNGFAFNLYLQWKDIKIREPEGYQVQNMQKLAQQYPADMANTEESLPNIIVIMNESFADLRVLGEFDTNIDVLPVLDNLKKNTIKGNLYASVYGGNTANSEYEFLTGCSIEYFSERVVPFQLYMNEQRPSFISQAKQLGYQTVFMHPYRAYSWNRPSVYTALQADEMIYEEDMMNLSYIRSYASDVSQYTYIKQYLEQKQKDQPLFLFDVTVQNHGGYTGTITELSDQVTIVGHEGKFTETENYLTLVHESDRALGELLSYLENYEEPTAVLFFGDHQPAIETAFVEMALGKKESEFTLEDRQKMYTVPFFLWCNYELPERQIDRMSINYLSTFLCSELGLPKTGMQNYLTDLYQDMPVINSVAIADSMGQFALKADRLQEQNGTLAQYNEVIYNYMFDSTNRQSAWYRLQDN